MKIGVPKEIKTNENRVALTPGGAEVLRRHGHKVFVLTGAGLGSGFSDAEYKKAGATILKTAKQVFDNADMIMKVKEPIKSEYNLIRENQVVFTYFHFASSKDLTDAMMKNKCIAIAYETVQKEDGSLPLLIPMSEVAGRMAPQEGAKYLERTMGGRGVLLGGVPGTEPSEVVVLGGGIVGTNAAKIAAGFGAKVTIMDNNLMMSNPHNIRAAIQKADLVIGAVLIAGAKAPKLITKDMLKLMKKASVVVDVSVDQGGCIETCRPTTHENPTYVVNDVVHYCVANMPGAVPFTSTIALTNSTLPYAVELANKGWHKACVENEELKLGLNMISGEIVYKGVADAFKYKFKDVNSML